MHRLFPTRIRRGLAAAGCAALCVGALGARAVERSAAVPPLPDTLADAWLLTALGPAAAEAAASPGRPTDWPAALAALAKARGWQADHRVRPDVPRRVVIIVPQYHRSETAPIAWSSLGKEIAGVQLGVADAVSALALARGVTCLGTEGSVGRQARSGDLDRMANAGRRFDAQVAALLADATLAPATHAALRALDAAVKEARPVALMLSDGPGVGLLGHPGAGVTRFGIEDRALLDKARAIARKRAALTQKRAPLLAMLAPPPDPSAPPPARDVIGAMFLEEYPAFEARTARPIAQAQATLEKARQALLHAGDVDVARDIAVVLHAAAPVLERAYQLDGAQSRYSEEQAIEAARLAYRADTGASVQPESRAAAQRGPSAAARKKAQREVRMLDREIEGLNKAYAAAVYEARNARAAAVVHAEMDAQHTDVCTVVMGARHTSGLAAALATGAHHAGPQTSVVVLKPYAFDDGQ